MSEEKYFYQVTLVIKQETEVKGEIRSKNVKRELVVEAINQTDVETKVTKHMEGDMRGEWFIEKTAIRPNFEAFIS